MVITFAVNEDPQKAEDSRRPELAICAARSGPLATLRAYAARMADLAPTPDALLRNLAYLQGDLADDALRRHLVENARASRREIEALLAAAIAAGELRRHVDVCSLARTVETVIGGSLMSWAAYRDGKAVDWIGMDLEAVLAPWLRRPRAANTAPGRKRRTSKRPRPGPRG